jgi:lysozyme
VIDLEFYGDYASTPLSRKETKKILDALLENLESYYHVKPIIYTTTKAYYQYLLGGGYGDYPLWFRNTYQEPSVVDWSFWQYSDEGKLAGYDGIQPDHTEMYIDLNVYHSSYEAFLKEFSLPETTYETLEKENQP